MFRSFALFCCAVVFVFSAVFAQDESAIVKIKATPEVLSLFDESLQSLSQEAPNPRAVGLFRLLNFAANFDDAAPAQKIIDALLTLAPSIEPEALRDQLFTAIASTYCDLEKYAEAVEILKHVPSTVRSEAQLDVAIKIIAKQEQDKPAQPFDVAELLRQTASGATESQNVVLETVSLAFLGHELARQGKSEESIAAFARAARTSQKIEDTEERGQIVGMMLQYQVEHNQIADAMTVFRTVAPEIRPTTTVALVSALKDHEKYDEAEALIKTLPSGEMRDNLLGSFMVATIKTITDAKVGELADLVSTDELRERLVQTITAQLQKNGRDAVAAQVGKRLKEPTVAAMSLFIGKVESLLEEKKFAEAIKFIDETEENEAIRQHLKRQILIMQYRETHDESVAAQIETIFTRNERVAIMELREEAKRVAETGEHAERMDLLFAIFQEQNQFFDFVGALQTVKLVAVQLDRGTEPVQTIRDRLLVARLQVELQDKGGAKANLGKLMQTLSAVSDLNELKDLVQVQDEGATVEASAIQNQLFQVYLIIANLLARSDAPAESQTAFVKAKELAKTESVAPVRAEKLLVLAQFLAGAQE